MSPPSFYKRLTSYTNVQVELKGHHTRKLVWFSRPAYLDYWERSLGL